MSTIANCSLEDLSKSVVNCVEPSEHKSESMTVDYFNSMKQKRL